MAGVNHPVQFTPPPRLTPERADPGSSIGTGGIQDPEHHLRIGRDIFNRVAARSAGGGVQDVGAGQGRTPVHPGVVVDRHGRIRRNPVQVGNDHLVARFHHHREIHSRHGCQLAREGTAGDHHPVGLQGSQGSFEDEATSRTGLEREHPARCVQGRTGGPQEAQSEGPGVHKTVTGPVAGLDHIGAQIRKPSPGLRTRQDLDVGLSPSMLGGHQLALVSGTLRRGGRPEVTRLGNCE